MFLLITVSLIDKSTLKIYYPIIDKTFVLKKELCLEKLNNYIGIYQPIDCKGIKLPKNTPVTVKRVIKNKFFIFPSYFLILKTPYDEKIKEKLQVKEIKVFASSFLSEIGKLKNIKISNFFQNNSLIIFFYFLYLVLMVSYINIPLLLKTITYFIAYYYILLSAINDGFSSFLLGIPFLIFVIFEIFKNKGLVKYLNIFILILFLILLISDKSKNSFIYPLVNKEITLKKDLKYEIKNGYLEFSTDSNKTLKNKTIKFISQKVANYADISTNYVYEIKLDNKKLLMNEGDVILFLKYENIPYPHSITNSPLFYFSFYILIYPFVLLLFIFLIRFLKE